MEDALIVVNLQNDFISGSLGGTENEVMACKITNFLSEWGDGHVFLVGNIHGEEYGESLESKKFPLHCQSKTSGVETWGPARDVLEEKVKGKVHGFNQSTFGSLVLPQALKNLGEPFDRIHIMGIHTDIGVLTNALILRSWFPNKKIYCHANLCLGTSPEAHEAAVKAMKSSLIDVFGGGTEQ